MRHAFLLAALLLPLTAQAQQQQETYDYWRFNRDMIQHGVQAILQCNGLFTSNRTIEQVFDDELKYLRNPVGTARGGDYSVDYERKAVTIGAAGGVPPMRAAFREGIGCVILPPDQTYVDIDHLPILELPYPETHPETTAWPMGDVVNPNPDLSGIDAEALQAASDWSFNRPTPEQRTLSLLIIHKGEIIHERYADGFEISTRTRTWSTAKSIAATLIGMLVDEGALSLDGPLDLDWNPEVRSPETDPRHAITLRDLLHMSSGLEPIDNRGMEYATGSGLSYWAGASSVEGALSRALVREPGTYWDYENYDTILAVYAMKRAIGDAQAYLEFPRKRLLDKIGMRNTLLSTDRFGDFIMSSQIYTNARDLGRFGLLYLNGGMWNGERLISEEWIDFVTTPAPASAPRGNFYGGQFWLVPDNRTDVPKTAYSTAGNRGQFVIVVPTHDLVIVRRGLDYGRQGFNRWDLTREVLKAFGN
ncbi:MAG: serine hydrolase [Rhodothermales bacterium]|nr:serine hydrolase [Rhodothermales bacterium]